MREHATTHMQYIDGEIQTWRSYFKNSSIRIWIFMTQQQEKVTEKATKWIKMKRCVGIHSSEMTSSPKRKRMGDRPIFQQVSPSTAIPTLSDCYKGLQLTFPSVLLCSEPALAVSPSNALRSHPAKLPLTDLHTHVCIYSIFGGY